MRVVVLALSVMTAAPAHAGPWTLPEGTSQTIIKHEQRRSNDGFDEAGQRVALPGPLRDNAVGVWAEYGLTDRVTLQLKGDWQDNQDATIRYERRGPIELGATFQIWRNARSAVSVYGGYADAGDARNPRLDRPGAGTSDWEVRTSIGHAFGGNGRSGRNRSFADIQFARRMRDGMPDETRGDFTFGTHYGQHWLVLGQAFGGMSDGDRVRWLTVETSAVRHFGRWSLQGGWRQSVAGRQTPVANGAILALWRRF